jgi:hypothetical protein
MGESTGSTGNNSAPKPDSTESASKRQQGNHNRGGRGGRGGYKAPTVPRQPKFEGKCDDLKGQIYDCSDSRQADVYVKTTKEMAEHVGRTFKYGMDARLSIESLKLHALAIPSDPSTTATATEKRIWEKEVDEYVKRRVHLDENMKTVYSLAWGQCTDILRAKLEALTIYNQLSADGDGIGLLKAIKTIAYNFESQKYLVHALHEAKRRFYNTIQRGVTVQVYFEQFNNNVEVVEHCGGSLGNDTGIGKMVMDDYGWTAGSLDASQTATLRTEVKDRYLATAFLLGAERSKYGKLVENLENDFLQGHDNYPKTLDHTYKLLANWKHDPRNLVRVIGPGNDGVSFNTDGTESEVSLANQGQRGNGGRDKSQVTCHKCGKKGHYANEGKCKAVEETKQEPAQESAATMLMHGVDDGEFDDAETSGFLFNTNQVCDYRSVALKIGKDGKLPRSWILLDNQSTVDVFNNDELLTNIRQGETSMTIHCNAGTTKTNLIGDLPGYGTVWYHPSGIANILKWFPV